MRGKDNTSRRRALEETLTNFSRRCLEPHGLDCGSGSVVHGLERWGDPPDFERVSQDRMLN